MNVSYIRIMRKPVFIVAASASILSIVSVPVAKPEPLDESCATPKVIENAIGAKAPFESARWYRRLYAEANDIDLIELQRHHDRGLAMRTAWERVRRCIPKETRGRSMSVDPRFLFRFLGFVEGRLQISIPQWWEKGVLRSQAHSRARVSFTAADDERYRECGFGFQSDDATVVYESKDGVVLDIDEVTIILPDNVLKSKEGILDPLIRGLFTATRCYVWPVPKVWQHISV